MKKLSHREWTLLAEQKNVPELGQLASMLSIGVRRQLLAFAERQINHTDLRAAECTRVALCKLLIALVPESWKIIRRLIRDRGCMDQDEEVRFSLFCFLDDLPRLTGGRGLASEVVCVVGDYLRCAQSNRAHATWMAGDLLGDHWDQSESVPILVDVLESGKYVEGRIAALHGLEHAVGNTDCPETTQLLIDRSIHRAATNDQSKRVREFATRIRDGASGCSRGKLRLG